MEKRVKIKNLPKLEEKIKKLDNTEVTMFLAMNQSFEEYKKEQMDRNARHQEAARSHPKFPK